MKNQDPEVHYTEVYCESKLNIQTHNMANGGKSNLGSLKSKFVMEMNLEKMMQ